MPRRVALLVALALAACSPTPPIAESPSPKPTETALATAAATATLAAASPSAVAPASGISANALGPLTGNWIFFPQWVPNAANTRARLEVWGIAPNDQQRLAFSYEVSLGGVPEAMIDNAPYLRRQFSPDGRQIAVSTLSDGLVVVDLVSGQTRGLGTAGFFPSWSKDGKTIAYINDVAHADPQRGVQDHAIWVVPAAGGTPRELVNVGSSSTSPEWSGDSRLLMAQLADGVGLVDVASGREVPGGRIPFALTTTGAHWPGGSARATVTLIRRDDTQIVMYDDAARVTGFLQQFARPHESGPGLVPRDPRWNPTGNGEVLFVLLDEKANRTEADVLDTHSGQRSRIVGDVEQATWSSDGTKIVYVARVQQGLPGAVRVYDRITGTDRELVARMGPNNYRPSIVSVAY
ncbi:MAG TPA: hypothetical protein VGK15_07505 [Candidatus Limnocylindria bacterium]